MEHSDERLLELALQGDGACFGELAERWQNRIFRFIRRHTGNSEDAKDLTQDTFTKAYQNLGRLSDPRKFSSWLYTIALNECRMRFRRLGRASAVPFEEYLAADRPVSAEPSPERAVAANERATLLGEAFQELPEEQRAAIVMKEYQGLKFHEIAEVMDIPVSTAKSRVYLGLKTLRRIMEKRL